MSSIPPKSKKDAQQNQLSTEDCLEIAEKVRTGEYFRESRNMYDISVHDPMAERYMFLFITVISVIILLIALKAAQDYYPLNRAVPLIFDTNDAVEDIPHIQKLQVSKEEDPGEALLRFMVKHYVMVREEYNIATFDRDVNSVKNQSAESTYKDFQQLIDPRNPDSPITMYQRHSKRKISILSTKRLQDGMDVVFEASVESKAETKKTHWRANIAFQYSGIGIDQKTGTVTPVSFVVTKYHSKRLQDVK